MNKLLSMATFVRVVESGSFTAAAGQLGVSVSAVAKAVSRLEEDLQTQLLVRSTRKLSLNDDGRAFYSRCQQILNDIEDAESSVKSARQSPRGHLRMAMPVLFGRLTFLPRMAELSAPRPRPCGAEITDRRFSPAVDHPRPTLQYDRASRTTYVAAKSRISAPSRPELSYGAA